MEGYPRTWAALIGFKNEAFEINANPLVRQLGMCLLKTVEQTTVHCCMLR